jgi:cytochrome bd ubiquinol oxidase subunit II
MVHWSYHGIDLPTIWFLILGLVMVGYVILDGFDLGVGAVHLFARRDQDRRIFLNAIGPVWDGNEVWFVVLVGASLAGFPRAYAALCTLFYMTFTLLLVGIIFRAVAIEFRSKLEHHRWRLTWDWLFCLSSIGIAFLLGIVLGNLVHGVPLDSEFNYTGTLSQLFHPYALLIGLLAVVLFALHGSIYLLMKTEGALHERVRRLVHPLLVAYLMGYVLTTMITLIYQPHMADALRSRPFLFGIAALNLLAVANVPREIYHKRDGRAFISSAIAMCLLLLLFAMGQYPTLIRNPAGANMTIYDASASDSTLIILLIIVGIGVPLVLAYTISIYRIFRGKVKIGPTSY